MELSKQSKIELTKFCIFLTEQQIFKSSQSARNALAKAEKKKLIVKNGINKKTISIILSRSFFIKAEIIMTSLVILHKVLFLP